MAWTASLSRMALAVLLLAALTAIWASGSLLLAEPPENNPATGAPRIDGAAQLGEVLSTCSFGCIADANGMAKAAMRYQWIRKDSATETDTSGARGALYTIVVADVGKTLRVRVSFTDDAGNQEKLTSAPTRTVSGTRNSPTTGAPAITGTARVGQTLSLDTSGIADADGLTRVSYSGVWNAGIHFRIQFGPGEDSGYRVSRGDLGLALKVTLDFEDDAGKRVTLDSAPTAVVAPTSPAAPELFTVSKDSSGDPELTWEDPVWDYGGELNGRPTWGDGGSPITGYVVQWKEKDDSWSVAADVSETPVTNRRHTIRNLTGSREYAIRVMAVNAVGRGIPTGDALVAIEGSARLSSDASLSALTLSNVDFGPFDPETTTYSARVANSMSRTLVVPVLGHSRASYVVKLGGAVDADGLVALSVGSNVITIEVTAEDRQTTRTYTVTVTRAGRPSPPPPPPLSSDASLSALTLSDVDFGTFTPETTSYTTEVANSVTQTKVTPTVNHSGASYVVKLDGTADADGVVDLSVGDNVITVEVTAENRRATRTYTVTLTRMDIPVPTPASCTTSLGTVGDSVSRDGSWTTDCESEVPGRGHALYYTFTLPQDVYVTIDLASTLDTYLYLREGEATSGTFLHENDDLESGDSDSQIAADLAAGTYTIEATTRAEDATGSFTLSVGTRTPVTTGCTPASLTLSATGVAGSWADDCESGVSGRGRARFYTFTLTEELEVTIDLSSDVDTYLYLRAGTATSGTALHSNDDIENGNTNSRIVADLEAGTYTVEATTYSEDKEGGFTISVSGSGSGPQTPVADCTPAALTLPAASVPGAWANDCESSVSGRGYARYYTFTLARNGEVIISLSSDVDTYLYLREGSAVSGDSLYSNDDFLSGSFDSQIVADLETGTYTVEATTYAKFAVGSFTLSVGGLATEPLAVTACTPMVLTLPATAVAGTWVADCQSAASERGYARYYTFTLAQHSDVTIDLASTEDSYLYLREGNASSGEFLQENDDIESSDSNSRIAETLTIGTYTIEATTYNEDTTGSFTLSVTAQVTQTPVATGCDPAALTFPATGVSGSWTDDCQSDVSGRGYARYYSFTITEETEVTIDLSSSVDTYLYVREGSGSTGEFLYENDDAEDGNTDSRIVEMLPAGTFTIEATTYNQATTGSFTLSVGVAEA